MTSLFNAEYHEIIEIVPENAIIVTDPPFNVWYHYDTFKDRKPKDEYFEELANLIRWRGGVVIHYPEALHELSIRLGYAPTRVVAWVYNSNTAKQHRSIAFYGVKPDFSKVRQPYKNPKDKRIIQRIAEGKTGAKLYDWWNVNQVKNVSSDKTWHPCQMPLEVMENIIGILPKWITVFDPFMGSGTTGLACQKYGVPFIGSEMDAWYYEIAKARLQTKHAPDILEEGHSLEQEAEG